MTSIRQPGVSPQSIQQAGARAASQQSGQVSGPQSSAATQLSPQERLVQSAGLSGSASPIALVADNPYNNQIRRLLAQNDFESLERILLQASPQELAGLDLSLGDIERIAQGLGHGSWGQSLPLIGGYRDDQKQVISKLIQASELNPNQKIGSLKRLVGPEAVLSYVRSAPQADLSALSNQNRHMALAVLDPGNSIWGSVSSAVTEAVDRRLLGNSREGDQIASRILRSAPNASELKGLLQSINSYNRDDVVYRYVLDLPARELAALSDESRRLLMASLVDSSSFGLDLDKLGNLDELFNMTFPEHAEAAQRLYQSMSASAQGSAEVQALVQKSDDLMQRIQTLEANLRADLASGQLPREKIAAYTEQINAIQSQYPDQPEIQQKVTELLGLLQAAQQRLDQTARIASQTESGIGQAENQIEAANSRLQAVEAELGDYLSQLSQSQLALRQSAQKIETQYQALSMLYSQLEGPEAQGLVAEMQGLLQNDTPLPQKEARLQQITRQLQALSSRLEQQGTQLSALRSEIDQTQRALAQQRQSYQEAVAAFDSQRTALSGQQHELNLLLKSYEQQTGQLNEALNQARQRWDQLKDNPALQPADRRLLEEDLTALNQAVSRHKSQYQALQSRYDSAVLPGVQALDSRTEQVQLQADTAAAKAAQTVQQVSLVEHSFNIAQAAWDKAQHIVSGLLDKASDLTSQFKTRLASVSSAEELDQMASQISGELSSLRAELAEHMSEAEMQGHLQQLEQVLSQVNQTRALLQETRGLQSAMASAQASFEQEASSLRQTIAAAQQEANDALENIESDWQPRIASVKAELERLEGELNSYAGDVSTLQAELAQNDAQKVAAKQAFAEALKNAPNAPVDIPALQQDLLTKISALDSQRQELEIALSGARLQMDSVSASIGQQRKTLNKYQEALTKESTQLSHLHARIDSQRAQLAALQARNQQQLQQNAQLLAQQREGLPPALNQALTDLSGQQAQLQAIVSQTQALLDDRSGQEAIARSSESLQSYVSQVQKDLQTAVSSLDSTTADQALVQQKLDAMASRLDSIAGAHTATRQSAQQFLQALENAARHGGMDPEALWAGAQQVLARAETAEDVAFALNQMNTLMAEIDSRVQLSSELLRSNDERMNHFEARVGDIEAGLSQIHDTTRGMARAITALQNEVDGHASALLSSQRDLLERRRSLGISSQSYQQALQQYDNLLSLGRELRPDEIQQLQQLESTLSGIEASLMQSNRDLQQRLGSLNQLKSRVNEHLVNLRDSLDRLSVMGRKLQQMRPDIESSHSLLAEEHARLSADREQLLAVIATVEQGPAAGTPRVQAQLRELRARLANMDQALAELSQGMERQERLLGRISQTEAAIQAEMQLAQLQLAQLELLFAKVDELIVEANRQLQEVKDLLQQVQSLKQEVSQVKEQVSQQVGTDRQPAPPKAAEAPLAEAQEVYDQRDQLQKNSFSVRLSDRLTSFWSQQRNDKAQRREAEHQQQREALQHELEQRLALARQYDETLQLQLQQQQSLEQSTTYLIQQIENGQRANSGLNLV
ncbi:MAG: hypothetical protein IGS03_05795 [Candidatus Sericytochromatia bacterium]|nr:hypothetical protein [Candidatus Sericytochromatia bacterium]